MRRPGLLPVPMRTSVLRGSFHPVVPPQRPRLPNSHVWGVASTRPAAGEGRHSVHTRLPAVGRPGRPPRAGASPGKGAASSAPSLVYRAGGSPVGGRARGTPAPPSVPSELRHLVGSRIPRQARCAPGRRRERGPQAPPRPRRAPRTRAHSARSDGTRASTAFIQGRPGAGARSTYRQPTVLVSPRKRSKPRSRAVSAVERAPSPL